MKTKPWAPNDAPYLSTLRADQRHPAETLYASVTEHLSEAEAVNAAQELEGASGTGGWVRDRYDSSLQHSRRGCALRILHRFPLVDAVRKRCAKRETPEELADYEEQTREVLSGLAIPPDVEPILVNTPAWPTFVRDLDGRCGHPSDTFVCGEIK